jgi:multidrug efflux pump subunit AcrA (membrane-fusion protein)
VRLFARFGGAEREWRGRVVRTEGEIDARSRMVHVVARVEDPYGRSAGGEGPPLAVGLFVRGEIQGRTAPGVAVLPRAALRGDDQVLVLDDEGRLRFRDVEVLRALRDEVVVSGGLAAGERVCVSALETVVEGMKVRVAPAVDVAAEGRKS